MPILQVFLVLIAVGVILWAVTSFIPMNETVKRIIVGLAILLLILWLLSLFGVFDSLSGFYVGSRHDGGPVHRR